jgi:putative MFS transporter
MGAAMKYACVVLVCALLAYVLGPESLGKTDDSLRKEIATLQARESQGFIFPVIV